MAKAFYLANSTTLRNLKFLQDVIVFSWLLLYISPLPKPERSALLVENNCLFAVVYRLPGFPFFHPCLFPLQHMTYNGSALGLPSPPCHDDVTSAYLPGVNILANSVSQHSSMLSTLTAASTLSHADSMSAMLNDYQHLWWAGVTEVWCHRFDIPSYRPLYTSLIS